MKSRFILLETILITLVTLLGMWLLPAARTPFALIPVAYLLIERRLRKRTWSDLGFRRSSFWVDLRANWVLFILLAFLIQPVTALWAMAYFPEYLAHVQARLPFESGMSWGLLLPLLAVSLLGEELTYRTLIQGRLAWFLGAPAAIISMPQQLVAKVKGQTELERPQFTRLSMEVNNTFPPVFLKISRESLSRKSSYLIDLIFIPISVHVFSRHTKDPDQE